jgi:ABC-type nitrate/sulfonate/bicarbonate transport system substrate-binding protein
MCTQIAFKHQGRNTMKTHFIVALSMITGIAAAALFELRPNDAWAIQVQKDDHETTPIPMHVNTFIYWPPLAVAAELGYFADEGLDVKINITPSSTVQMHGLAVGTWDIALTTFDDVIASSADEGVSFKAFGYLNISNLQLVASPEIPNVEALRFHPLAVDAPNTGWAVVLRKMLLNYDMDLNRGDYTLVSAGGLATRIASMTQRQTFGTVWPPPVPANVAPLGFHTVAYQRDIVPNYPGNVMAARADRLEGQSRDGMERFMSAWLRAAAYASDPANRDATVGILGHYGQTPLGAPSSIEGVTLNARPDHDHLIVPWNLRQEFGLAMPAGTVDNYFTTKLYDHVVHHSDDGGDPQVGQK